MLVTTGLVAPEITGTYPGHTALMMGLDGPRGSGPAALKQQMSSAFTNWRLAMMSICGMSLQHEMFAGTPQLATGSERRARVPVGTWDPLGLTGDCSAEHFTRKRAPEIMHGRTCMFAQMGYAAPEVLIDNLGFKAPCNAPVEMEPDGAEDTPSDLGFKALTAEQSAEVELAAQAVEEAFRQCDDKKAGEIMDAIRASKDKDFWARVLRRQLALDVKPVAPRPWVARAARVRGARAARARGTQESEQRPA